MVLCGSCGQENPDIARFCLACAVPLDAEQPRGEVRKTVTIVFSDLVGSTTLGESLDPESLRRVMSRYFDAMRGVLERHGGTVEKFIGDAIMAAFGIPEVHEEDALRAVRAAEEMRNALETLNAEFERERGVRIAVRTGVNTGEVVAGDPAQGQSFATGDAVNVAARLEQAADANEILIGEETYRLVRDAVQVEPIEPLSLKGKSDAVPAWRLLEVERGVAGVARRLDLPLVGREAELAQLEQVVDRAAKERSCQLVTILGSAGAGKSRLVDELFARVRGRAAAVQGRCLPYGEGITFWPVGEIVHEAAGITDAHSPEQSKALIERLLPPDEEAKLVAERIAGALGYSSEVGNLQELFWAVRKLLEALADEKPLVVVFDDVHWAEPGLLDLIEYLAGWSSGAPIVLVSIARQDLLELRPSLATPKPNASSLLLAPLAPDESARLIENVLGSGEISEDLRRRIASAAEGNPLFLEELVRMLIDDGTLVGRNGGWEPTRELGELSIPPTIQALLAARLDRLGEQERAVVQRASVVGKVFWWGAINELSPPRDRPQVGGSLQTLVRKELIRPDTSTFAGEDAFQFGHILVRDAAYQGLAKEARADHHERFVTWLEAKTGDRSGEYEEIIGYHLEQAFRYRAELRRLDDSARELGHRAGERLAAAGKRALSRGDVSAAANLLGRAARLVRAGPDRISLLLQYAESLRATGRLAEADDVLREAVEAADSLAEPRLKAHARIEQLLLRIDTDPHGVRMDEVVRLTEATFPEFEETRDDLGFSKTWRAIADVHVTVCRWGAGKEALERALAHARKAGDVSELTIVRNNLLNTLSWGPTPVGEGIAGCRAILEEARGQRNVEANALCFLGGFEAMRGDMEAARELCAEGRAIFQDLGHAFGLGAHRLVSGTIELLAGEPSAAEREFRVGRETLDAMGEQGVRSTLDAFAAEALYALGRYEEAEHFTLLSEEAASPEDATSQARWRAVRAKVLAWRGEFEAAERLAREATALAEQTDSLNMHGDSLVDLAEVLLGADRPEEAALPLRAAIGLYQAKGNVVSAERAQTRLEALSAVSG